MCYDIDMLSEKMSLMEMINYKPSQMEMAGLPLDIVVYIKVSIVSLYKEDNHEFIRFLFEKEDIKDYFKDLNDTAIYDFDSAGTNKERFVTIFELNSLYNFQFISDYLKETLGEYDHVADVIIDLYTHDDKEYRLSNLDGIVKLEELKKEA